MSGEVLGPVETLRAAAAKLRALAKEATPGPWGVGNGTNIVRGLEVTGRGSYTCIQSVAEIGDDRCDWDRKEAVETDPEDDAEWIAAVHPGIAEPLADWLDAMADRYAHWQDPRRSPEFSRPYAVARVLLGVPDA